MNLLSTINHPITESLDRFYILLRSSLKSTNPLLDQVIDYFFETKGKGIRPALLFLSARVGGAVGDNAIYSAIGLELLHVASLLHDDVVDESSIRRSHASVNAKWGDKVAILSGDFFLSTALQAIAQSGNERIIPLFAQLGRSLASGELLQLHNTRSHRYSEADYLDVIRSKTASLFSTCMAAGAYCGALTSDQTAHLAQFGELLGLCFQMRDDLLDYSRTLDAGKVKFSDLIDKKYTLPLIAALQNANQINRSSAILEQFNSGIYPDDIESIICFVEQNGGIDYTYRRMYEIREQALSHIEWVERDEIRQALAASLDFAIGREC